MNHTMKPVAPQHSIEPSDGVHDVKCKMCGSDEFEPVTLIKRKKTMVIGEDLVFAIITFVCRKCRAKTWIPANQPIVPVGPAEEASLVQNKQEIVH